MRLAYAMHGSGPALVCPAWWVSHLEEDWQDEGFRALFSGLAQHHTVVRYDRLGSGLSDRDRERADLAEEVGILGELVDHLELQRLSMFAVSCAGPPALQYCAEHPDRVERLVFFGSFLRGADVGPQPMKEAMQGLVRAHWGMGARAITQLFAPNLETEGVRKVSRAHRRAASPEMAAQLLSLTFDVDARSAAASVNAPTLVLHRKRDATIRLSAGRELAASLPHADLVTLEGDAHVPWIGDVDAVRRAVLEFLGAAPNGETSRPEPSGPRLHQQGELWALRWNGRTVHLKDARGLSDLAILLRRPGEAVHVATLWSGAESAAMGGSEDPVLDDEALASYRARFEELGELFEQAKAQGDAETATRLEDEREALAKELRGAVGLGGRKRQFAEPSQRARKAVTARIRASIKKIDTVNPELAAHLEQSISTGMSCSYDPDPVVRWDVATD